MNLLGYLATASVSLFTLYSTQDAIATEPPPAISASDYVDGGSADPAKVALGKLLFFDPVLSGNKNISCATCHHPSQGTGDGLALPVGEGGSGIGPERTTGDDIGTPIVERVPRNAPPIFALGHKDATVIFHDGRVTRDENGAFVSPAGDDLPDGLDNLVAVQAMFPVTSATEMAGQAGENSVADAADANDFPLIWETLAQRIRDIPAYRVLMNDVFGIDGEDITFVHIANAIGAFEIDTWRSMNTGYDRFVRGDQQALSGTSMRGMDLFFGKAGCGDCHSGPLFSDMQFHAIATPQVGPGKGQGIDGHEDLGRSAISGDDGDIYAFRTPPLRNIAFTGPYMHDGAFTKLWRAVRHHLDTIASRKEYFCGQEIVGGQLVLPSRADLDAIDCLIEGNTASNQAIDAANDLAPVALSEDELRDLVNFLKEGLTDKEQIASLVTDFPPDCRVPSNLPVDGCF